jgi:hypothetical protein
MDQKMDMTWADTTPYRSKRGETMIALGHMPIAVRMGMAEWIP